MALSTVEAAPQAFCQARRLPHDRALLDITTQDLIDHDLARLIQLGLSGTFRVEIILWRSKRFWFDKNVYSDIRNLTVTWSTIDQVPMLGETPIRIADPSSLEPIVLRVPAKETDPNPYYVEVNLQVEVVTTESLTKLAHWMVDHEKTQSKNSAISTTILQAIAHDLSREVRTRCFVNP